ncbi:MAG: GNAT family N-acetyltransferase [Gammaproteobacteria bacterium]|jgi:GNAT superfamily N-acetyltransferase|nr:GNAT family N-acetyltransferase [Gammaproteobacteria bacterium]
MQTHGLVVGLGPYGKRWVTLNPKFHQKGIGRAILNEIERRYPEACGMERYTRKINENSIAFYNKCGFKEVKEIEFDEPDLTIKTEKPILSQYVTRWLKNDAIFAPLDEKVPNIERFIGFRK